MIQIIGWILCFYLVIKGVEILQTALCSSRENRKTVIAIGATSLVLCIFGAAAFLVILSMQAGAPGLR